MNRAAQYAMALAVLLFLVAPIVPIHYFPWTSFYNEFVAGLALIFLLLFSVLKNRSLLFYPVPLAVLALSFVPLFQYAGGVIYFFGDALLAFSYLIGLALALAIGQQLYLSYQDKFLTMLAVLLVGLTAFCIYQAFYQWFELDYLGLWIVGLGPDSRPAGNISQSNNAATLFCLGLFSVLYLWEKKKFTTAGSVFIALFLLLGIVLTQSRTAWLVWLILLIWWFWKHKPLCLRITWPVIIVAPFIYAIMRKSLHYLHEGMLLNQPLREVTTLADARLSIWRELFQAVVDGPLWGYGWGQVAVAQASVNSSNTEVLYTQHSHNLFLDLLIWNGPLLGAVCVALIIYWGLKQGWAVASKEQWFLLLLIATILIQGMLEYPIEYGYFLFPLGLMIGALIKLGGKSLSVSPIWQGLIFVIALVLVSAIFREYRILEEDNRKLRMESVFVNEVRIPGFAPDVMLLTQLREFQRFARTEASDHMTAEEIEWMRQVTYRFPIPPMLMRYTLAQGLNGNAEEASKIMAKLHRLHGDELFEEAKASIIIMGKRYPQLKAIEM
jgi:O-antigen ligase